MPRVTVTQLASTLEQLQAIITEISQRLQVLEKRNGSGQGPGAGPAVPVPAAAPPVPAVPVPAVITEEELLAISAAVAAYLGVRAHIRQIRLVGSSAWAQEGRVSIQASHRL